MITLTYTHDETHPGFIRLIESLDRWGHVWRNIGIPANQYDGHMCKLQQLHRWLRNNKKETILFVDGHDTIVNGTQEQIENKFATFKHPFVVSAEMYCAPYTELHQPMYEASDFQISTAQRYGSAGYPYLNSGAFIGNGKAIYDVLDRLSVCRIPKRHNDQGLLTERYLRNPGKEMLLDVRAELFQSLFRATMHLEVVKGVAFNKITGTTPMVLHGNGGVNFDHLATALSYHGIKG